MANSTECNMNRETQQKSQNQNFEPLDKTSISTLKRNPKIEFCKTDLLKLLTYLEGELQARDIVIATLKSEKIKQYFVQNRHHSLNDNNDPLAALQRDSFAVIDNSRDSSEMCMLVNHQLNSLENLVIQQRRSQARVAKVLKEAEIRHRKEVETEIQNRKKFEREYIKISEILEAEKNRHKQIVFFLLAERKKIIMKYIEERKRSEDLAQILAEEKVRVDAMAEGLEEESKKSLQMEAELEKQLAQFYVDTQQLKLSLAKQEKRSKELEIELDKSQKENTILRQQLSEFRNQHEKNVAHPSAGFGVPEGTDLAGPGTHGNLQCVTPMMTSIAKVVQPTATVSSVPVSGPMTGIARSVSPGQHVPYVMYPPAAVSNNQVTPGGKVVDSNQYVSSPSNIQGRPTARADSRPVPPSPMPPSIGVRSATIANSPHIKLSTSSMVKNHSGDQINVSTVTRKPIPLGRGVPPPVPPNKPIIPPKKDGMLNRKLEAMVSENSDLKNSTMRGPALPSVKPKLQNASDKQLVDDQIKNESVAENPG